MTTSIPQMEWTAVSPAMTGSWVANSTYTGWFRQMNDELQVRFKIALAGAPTSASLTVNMPINSFVSPAVAFAIRAAVAADNEFNVYGNVFLQDAGAGDWNGYVVANNAVGSVAIMYVHETTGVLTAVSETAPFTFATGDSVVGYFSVPI